MGASPLNKEGNKNEQSPYQGNAGEPGRQGEIQGQTTANPPAYRFSFASRDDEAAYHAQNPSVAPRNSMSDESIDILSNIQKTKDYLAPTAHAAYGLKSRSGPKAKGKYSSSLPQVAEQAVEEEREPEREREYDLDSYRKRAGKPGQLQSEMMMRPTVSPKELQEVQKYATV